MENNNLKLREQLYNKMNDEYDSFIEDLKNQNPQVIIERAYEKVFKEETLCLFYPESDNFNDEQIKALNKVKKPLDKLYGEWLDCDVNINELYKDNIYDTLEDLILEQKETKNKNSKER